MTHQALIVLLDEGLADAALVAAVVLGSVVSLYAIQFLAQVILSNRRG